MIIKTTLRFSGKRPVWFVTFMPWRVGSIGMSRWEAYRNLARAMASYWRNTMTVRKALIIYLSIVALAVVGAWLLALLYDWRAGMALMTVVLLEHAWRVAKRIRQNKP